MIRRLYFMLPSLDSARRTADDLLLARIEDRRMHFLARRGTNLSELHEASYLQKSDLVHGAQMGLIVGGVIGLLITISIIFLYGKTSGQIWMLIAPPLACAAVGAWLSSMVGSSVPNSRLKNFEHDIEAGNILLMVDVPANRANEVQEIIRFRHPEAADHGIEPSIPAFP